MRLLSRTAEFVAVLAALVVVWQAYITLLDVPGFLLPTPASVGRAILDLALSGDLATHLGYTVSNLLIGFFIGAALGMAGGFGLAKSPRAERWPGGPILFLQTAPKIALAPLFVIWFGLGVTSKVVLIISLVVFPVLIGTLVGVRSLDRRFGDLARLLHLRAWQRFWRIELPSALPEIFIGLRVGAVQAVVGAILAEWMSGRYGLGYLMTFASATYKTPVLFAAVILTALLGILVYQVVDAIERFLLAWREDR